MSPITPNSSQPTTQSSKPEPLLSRLRQLVLSGTALPGSQLSEAALSEDFAVSRTPVREALKQLENEGLVEIKPRVGTFVRVPTRREIVEMFQLKESLEGLAAGLLARRGDVPELEQLRENLRTSTMAVRSDDRDRYAELVHDFHHIIVQGSSNEKLQAHYELLMNQLAYQRLVLKSVAQPGRMAHSMQEHEAVLEAIESKDHIGAEFAMRHHVVASSDQVFTAFAHEHLSSPKTTALIDPKTRPHSEEPHA
ncbi:GntR family transcriptional regulator [Pseudoclavibacter sp. CFCC 13796]|nr:GntR family transcriptional regulator [Pseudoclavibacter sp. CFCC 13796]